jgi:transcriptional regulator GlxA family with amidase domain
LTGAPAIRRIPVFVVLPPQTMLLDVAGPCEVLRAANRQQSKVCFDVHYVGASSSIATSIGLGLEGVDPLPESVPDNAMVVVVGSVEEPMQTVNQPSRRERASGKATIVQWLKTAIRPGHKLISICSGALLVGRAGLLDGYACTTHHVCRADLKQSAPSARVLENRLYVEDRDRYTSAGVTAGIDLMLHVVAQLTDHVCATAVARYLVVYLRRSGSDPQLSPWLDGRNHIHPAIHRVQDAIAADPTRPWTLRSLCRVAGASSRHLTRLFHEHTGMTINDYKNRLRVALARELLGHTQYDMENVAERAGFGSARQLRRAWRRFYPGSPRESRAIHA